MDDNGHTPHTPPHVKEQNCFELQKCYGQWWNNYGDSTVFQLGLDIMKADLQPSSELFQLSLNFFSFHPSTQLHTDIGSLQNQARFVVVAPESAFQAKIHFFNVHFPASTDWICHPTRATSSWKRSWCLPLRKRKALDRSKENQEELGAGVWRNEKTPPVFKSGSLFRIGRSFWEFVLMHALTCVVLLWEHMLDCCLHVVGFWARALHTAVSVGLCTPDSLEKFLYRFEPKHGRCSRLSECAPLYARWTRPLWHLFSKTTGFLFCAFDSYDHVR